MSDKLCDPGEDLDGNGANVAVVGMVGGREVVGECGPGDYEGEENAACNGLEEDIEAAVQDCSDGANVERQVRNCEPRWERDYCRAVRGLRCYQRMCSWNVVFVRRFTRSKLAARIKGTHVICIAMLVGLWWYAPYCWNIVQ